ncbi:MULTISPECIES: hypothetical protein [unclassified Paenibacillus]|uniref:hypothetical protein n=1 Tax=unclassified Paenibacillus TaxID=185978 RepID=UPI003683BF41
MSDVEAKLAQFLEKAQGLVLKDDNVVGQFLRKLGSVQSKVDTAAGDNIDQASFNQLQDEMAALNLDEATKSELLGAIGKVDGGVNSVSAGQFVDDVFGRLRNLQSSFTGSNVDVNTVVGELSRTIEQAKTQIEPFLGSLNLNGSNVLDTVQKLLGSRLR